MSNLHGPRQTITIMTRTTADYACYYNLQQRTCGHVWQARYFCTPLDLLHSTTKHLWQATAYVERNPVRARLVKYAKDFPSSSTRSQRDNDDQRGFLHLAAWRAHYDWTASRTAKWTLSLALKRLA